MTIRHHDYVRKRHSHLMWLVTIALLLCGCAGNPNTHSPSQATSTEHNTYRLSDTDTDALREALAAINTQPENAREKLVSLARRYPAHTGVATNLAIAHYQCEDYAQALAVADQVLNVDTGIAELYNLRGLVLIEQAQYVKAQEAFMRALDLQPGLAQAHYNLGLLYDVYFQDITTALDHYTHYLTAFPDDSDTRIWVEQLKRSLETDR